jgi:sugar lactone lactonase YvrE
MPIAAYRSLHRILLGSLMSVRVVAALALLALPSMFAQAQTAHFSGATATLGGGFNLPAGVAVDVSGNVYVADFSNNAVKKMPAGCVSSSCATTLGGGFKEPSGVVVDASGNVYVADLGNGEVKKIPASCISGTNDSTCVVALGTSAFSGPSGVALDASGNVYVADWDLTTLVEIPTSCISGANNSTCVKLLGSNFNSAWGVAVDAGGNVYAADWGASAVKEVPASCISGANNSTCMKTLGGGFNEPIGIAVDSSSNVYVGDSSNNAVKEIPASCISGVNNSSCVTTLTGTWNDPRGVAPDSSGNIYVANAGTNSVIELMPHAADFYNEPVASTRTGVTLNFTFDSGGTIGAPVALTQGASSKDFAVVTGGTCTSGANFSTGNACTVNATFTPKFAGLRKGAVNLPNSSGTVIATGYAFGVGTAPQLVFETTTTTTLGGGFGLPFGVAVDGNGNVYTADQNNNAVDVMPAGCASSTCVTSLNGGFISPQGLAVDGAGNLYVAEMYNFDVKMMPAGCTSPSCVTTLPAPSGGFLGAAAVAVDGSGNVYVADNYIQTITEIPNGCTDSDCMLSLGGFSSPNGVAVDSGGKIYVSDSNNNTVTVMPASCTSSSCVTTLGGGFAYPAGLAVDGGGNVYIADQNDNVLKMMPAGCTSSTCVTTLGSYNGPAAVALDGGGNLYLANFGSANVLEFPRTSAPSFTFPATNANNTSYSLDVVTLLNIGNTALTFPLPSTGNQNPSLSARFFTQESTCPQLISSSPSAGTLAAGASCVIPVYFSPGTPEGPVSGSLTITDNALNVANTTQTIALSGVGLGTLSATTVISSPTLTVDQPSVNITPVAGSGGTGTLTYALSPTTLPAGLSFNTSTGAITGQPTAASTVTTGSFVTIQAFPYTVSVTDADNVTATATFSLTVNYPVTATTNIASFLIYVGEVGVNITPVTGANGTTPLSYSISPSLPAGLSLSSSSGTISGNPLAITPATSYAMTVTDANGASASASFTFTVNPPPPPPLNFSSVPVGTSATQTLTFTVNAAGTMEAPQVLTMGITGLDFTDAGTGSCTANGISHSYNAGDTCTVNVAFAPQVPGARNGAVNLLNSSGAIIATGYVYGVGTGPQVVYGTNITTSVPGSDAGGFTSDLAVDASGNIYRVSSWGIITMTPANCTSSSCVMQLGGDAFTNSSTVPESIAVDGAGNVYVGGYLVGLQPTASGFLMMVPPGCTNSNCVTIIAEGNGVGAIYSLAVDGAGTIYALDFDGSQVIIIPPGCLISGCRQTVGDSTMTPLPSGMGLDAAGNIYIGLSSLFLVPPGCRSESCITTLVSGGGPFGSGRMSIDAAGNVYYRGGFGEVSMLPAGCTSTSCIEGLTNTDATGVALDASGTLYFASNFGAGGNSWSGWINKLTRNTAPTLHFPVTGIGLTNTETTSLLNIGNSALTFSSSLNITNPAFTLDSSNTCPNSASSTLAAGASCTLAVDFVPPTPVTYTGSLIATDNTLNVANTTQTIPLNGTGIPVAAKLAFGTPPPPAIAVNGNPGNITVLEEDANGNVITSLNDAITVTLTAPGGSSLSGTALGATAVKGVATFYLDPAFTRTVGVYTYTASVCNVCGNAYDSATPTVATETVTAAIATLSATSVTQTYGTATSSTITVTGTGGPTPTGMVTYSIDGGTSQQGTLTSGAYTVTIPGTLTAGVQHTLSVTYNGDTNYPAVTQPLTVQWTPVGNGVWVENANGSLSELTTTGVPVESSVIIAGGGGSATAGGIAFDSTGQVWSVNAATNQLLQADKTGAAVNVFVTSLSAPAAVTIDGNGQAWVANGNNSISLFSNAGVALSPAAGFTGGNINAPSSIAVDISGNVWIANSGNNSVSEVIGGAAPAVPLATGTANSTLGTKP